MLGAIFGALSAAMNKAAEVTEDVGHRLGMPEWMVGGLSGGFALVGKGFEAGQDIQLPNLSGGLAFVSGSISTALGSLTSNSPQSNVAVSEKCGANVAKAKMLESMPEDLSPYAANCATIQVPCTPKIAAQSQLEVC
jgi:hypothetical protein